MRAWVNGSLVDDPASVHGAVGGARPVAGDGVFEAVKVVAGTPFALTRHLDRLAASASALGLGALDPMEVRRGVAAVLADAPMHSGRLRITCSGASTATRGGRPAVTVTVAASGFRPWDRPAVLATVPWVRNECGALVGWKTTAYVDEILALAHARDRGADEAVLANTKGHLCEGTTSNVFYVLDGELRTPSLPAGCLPGVTRGLVLEWYGAREVDEPFDVLSRAAEVFITSTTRDVQPVGRIDARALEAPGPVTREVMAVWAERARETLDP